MNDFGQKLRALRKRRGGRLQDYAPRLGISINALAARERGHVAWRHQELPRIAEVYGLPKEQIIAWIWAEQTANDASSIIHPPSQQTAKALNHRHTSPRAGWE